MPHGHLPVLRRPAGRRLRPRSAQWRRTRRGRPDPDLHLGCRGRLRPRRLTLLDLTYINSERSLCVAVTDIKQFAHLTDADIEAIGRKLDQIRRDIEESRGADDAAYIKNAIKLQRGLAVGGRAALF